jgi:hypothetical protein
VYKQPILYFRLNLTRWHNSHAYQSDARLGHGFWFCSSKGIWKNSAGNEHDLEKKEVVIILDIEVSCPVTANNSTLNIPTAVTGMHHLERFVEHVDGKDVMYICAYNAQLNIVKHMAEHLFQGLRQENKHALADRISCVEFMTIDSSTGKDRKHTIVNHSGSDGFFFKDPRTLVALSRAKMSTLIVADLAQLASHGKVRKGYAFCDVAM